MIGDEIVSSEKEVEFRGLDRFLVVYSTV